MATADYVLVTPARDEEEFIAATIESVLAQRRRPLKWAIVSDGSTDRTDAIVAGYAGRHDFIQLLRRPASAGRNFSSKVAAFREGYRALQHLPFDFVGNLDADITVEPPYYARVLDRFAEEPRLGICSAVYWDRIGDRLQLSRTRSADTPGAAQMFRRQCYEDIGGYRSLERGGEDTLAAAMARMKGWTTRSFSEPKVVHNRFAGGIDGRRLLRYRFQQGAANYDWGAHPLFMIGKAFRRLDERPAVLGSLALLSGYFGLWLRRAPLPVSDDVVRFVRREQMQRLTADLPFLRRRRPEAD